MNDFVFQNTTRVYFGRGHLRHIVEELKQYGSRVLLIYGGGSIKKIGLYDTLTGLLAAAGLRVSELAGVEPNPRHTTVNKGAAICRKERIDVLLAVGGGSTIDCAKAVAAATFHDGDCWELVSGAAPVTRALPLVVVLTLAATGSEMDTGCVISNMERHSKQGLLHPLLAPKVSFLDPTNTFSVNAYQTACGSVDIMSHVFDLSYFSRQPGFDMIDRMSEELFKTIIKYAPIAIREPENYEARANLMWASSWALNGFLTTGIIQAPVCHAMEHELSAWYDITHGLGLAIITPRWLSHILDETTAPAIARLGVRCFDVDTSLPALEAARQGIERLSDFFFTTLGLKSRLSDLGIDDTNFAAMAQSACGGGELESLKPLRPADVEAIYRLCL